MTDIPIEIPLELPGGFTFLRVLLVLTFILHIFFVGLMVGGTYWSIIYRIIGFRDRFSLRLAKEILDTVTITKSLAVVIGVAPLLVISLIYTIFWYSAIQLTYPYFLSIIWLVIMAFLLLYVYKYTWDDWKDTHPILHLSIGAGAAVIFTVVPFIFLNNINLMLLPFQWNEVEGFFDALLLPNVFPRYLHFFVADFANIGFFAAAYFWYVGRNSDDPFYPRAWNIGLRWALIATLLQGVFGPLNLFTMPQGFYSTGLLILVLVGIALVTAVSVVIIWMFQSFSAKKLVACLILIGSVAIVMSFIRDTVRTNLLQKPEQIAQRNSQLYFTAVDDFLKTYVPPEEAKEQETGPSGKALFNRFCASCHAEDHVLVGPPFTYMVEKYHDRPEKMEEFILNPVKVNPELPRMPKIPVSKSQAHEITEYILSGAWKNGSQQPEAKMQQNDEEGETQNDG
jgi:cytochrome c